MGIYMHYDGIKGDASEKHHKEWIKLNSLSFAAFREAETDVGQTSQRQGGGVTINDITVTKPLCHGSMHLFDASLVGHGKKVTIDITRSAEKDQTQYLRLILDHCCVTNYSVDSNGVSHNECLTLNFTAIEMHHRGVDVDLKEVSKGPKRKFCIAAGKEV
jgi:type VI secretion system secreted protein Hcp